MTMTDEQRLFLLQKYPGIIDQLDDEELQRELTALTLADNMNALKGNAAVLPTQKAVTTEDMAIQSIIDQANKMRGER